MNTGAPPASSTRKPSIVTRSPVAERAKTPARVSRSPSGVSIRKNPSPSMAKSSAPPVASSGPCAAEITGALPRAIDSDGAPSARATYSENTSPPAR